MKMLVIDDDPTIRECLRAGLEHRGHEVEEAESVLEFCDVMVSRNFPDAVVTDGNFLGVPDGLFILEMCSHRKIPAVMQSGDADLVDQARALGFRATMKPAMIPVLLEAIGVQP